MAKKKEHLQQAKRNQQVCDLLGEKDSEYIEWVITTIYYTALHHLEAAFACIKGVYHSETCRMKDEGVSHARWRLVKKHFSREVAFSFYSLENASKSVRYLLGAYHDYYSYDIVGDFIDKDLKQIIQATRKIYNFPQKTKNSPTPH